jgi:Transcription factor WhiB
VQVLPEVAEENTVSKQLAGLIEAIHDGVPDLERGLCIGQWDLFDDTEDPAAVDQAIELCSQCSVRTRCAEWVNSLTPRRRPLGVVAGEIRQAD